MMKKLIFLTLFLVGTLAPVFAISDEAEMLIQRQLVLFDTDSADVFMDVSERLKTILKEEGEEEQFYKTWYYQITYVFDNVSSSKALNMIGEIRDYADNHGSKFGFFIVSILNAHIAKDMGMTASYRK